MIIMAFGLKVVRQFPFITTFFRISKDGIHIDSVSESEIIGNFFTLIYGYAVRAPFAGVRCTDNWYWDNGTIDGFTYGGVVAENTGSGDPKFVAYIVTPPLRGNNYALQVNSP